MFLDLSSVEINDEHGDAYDGLPVVKLLLKTAKIDQELASDLNKAAEYLDDNHPSGVLIIANSQKDFCLGWKPDFAGQSISSQQGTALASKWERALTLLSSLPCPIIGKINGHCLGWGISLAYICDWRWCTKDALFASTELDFGLPPGMYSWQLTASIGLSNARRLILAGQTFSAQEAVQIGLADEIVGIKTDDAQIERIRNFYQKLGCSWKNARRLLNESSASLRENHLGTYLAALSQSLSQK